jgi:transcriptional regulator with XRE-family HTH domain
MDKKARKKQKPSTIREPKPEDVVVGAKVRVRRIEQRMSQVELAQNLGVTFQQIQKYEKGVNRIAGTRLQKIAEVLDIPVSHFLESQAKGESNLIALVMDASSQRLLRAFHKIKDGPMRHKIVGLLESITEKKAA